MFAKDLYWKLSAGLVRKENANHRNHPHVRKPEAELGGPGSEALRVNSEHTPPSPSTLLLSRAFRQVQAPGFWSELHPVSELDSHKHSRNLLTLNAVTRGLALQKEKQRGYWDEAASAEYKRVHSLPAIAVQMAKDFGFGG